jgi:arylformamidase
MPIFDISLPLNDALPIWPGDPPFEIDRILSFSTGDEMNLSKLSMSVHTGTHVDAPAHFLPSGVGIEAIPLEALIGETIIVDMGDANRIDEQALVQKAIPTTASRVLFKTRNSKSWAEGEVEFRRDFVGLTEDGAEWLTSQKIFLVGIDYLSIAIHGEERNVHRVLLEAGVVILEGLDLSITPAGSYELYCLPLRLEDCEAAPARAVLIG